MRKYLAILILTLIATAIFADVELVETDWATVKIAGFVQFRFTQLFPENDSASGDFSFKRARLYVKGDVTDYWSFKLGTDFTNTGNAAGADLLEFSGTFKPLDYIHFHLGRMKAPFSIEWLTSAATLPFTERAALANAAPHFRDGLMVEVKVEGDSADTHWLNLKLGLFDGDFGGAFGYTAGTVAGTMDYAVYLDTVPIAGLKVGGYLYLGNDYTYSYTDLTDPDNPVVYTDTFNQLAYGGGVVYDHDYFRVGGEYGMGTWNLSEVDDPNIPDLDDATWSSYNIGALGKLQVGGDLLNMVEIGARYDSYDPNSDTDNDAVASVTGGVNLYFTESHWAKLQLDFTYGLPEDDAADNDMSLIAQLQLKF